MDDPPAGRSSNKLRAAVNRAEREAHMSGVLVPEKLFMQKSSSGSLLRSPLAFLFVCTPLLYIYIFYFSSVISNGLF